MKADEEELDYSSFKDNDVKSTLKFRWLSQGTVKLLNSKPGEVIFRKRAISKFDIHGLKIVSKNRKIDKYFETSASFKEEELTKLQILKWCLASKGTRVETMNSQNMFGLRCYTIVNDQKAYESLPVPAMVLNLRVISNTSSLDILIYPDITNELAKGYIMENSKDISVNCICLVDDFSNDLKFVASNITIEMFNDIVNAYNFSVESNRPIEEFFIKEYIDNPIATRMVEIYKSCIL